MRSPFFFVINSSAALCGTLTALILIAQIVFSTHGGEIAFERRSTNNNSPNSYWEIFVLDVQTGVTYNLTRTDANNLTPAWSPDGSEIAFISDRSGENRLDLYVMNANGSNLHRVGSAQGQYANPTWTAAGDSLVVTHGWQQIVRLSVANDAEQWLAAGFAPRLSPDGKELMYYANGTSAVNSHVYLFNLMSHHTSDLTPGPIHSWDGQWSPDGQQIVYASLRDDGTNIYLMNADGSDQHPITHDINDVSPSWSPDGRQIVYASGVSGAMQLYVINADGSGHRMVTGSGSDDHAPVWRP